MNIDYYSSEQHTQESGVMNDNILQVRMLDKTVKDLQELKENIGAQSFAEAVKRAIEISNTLAKYARQGNKIIIESKRGRAKQLTIHGAHKNGK